MAQGGLCGGVWPREGYLGGLWGKLGETSGDPISVDQCEGLMSTAHHVLCVPIQQVEVIVIDEIRGIKDTFLAL